MLLASLWMLLSCILFALMGHFVKIASDYHHSFELMFYRSLGSLILMTLLLSLRRISPKTRHFPSHLNRSLFGLFAMLSYFFALTHLPVPTAITLNYTSPLFLGVFGLFIFKDKPKLWTWLALVVGFVGILLLMKPQFSKDTWLASLIGLSSGAMAAMAYSHIKQLGAYKEPALRIVFYFSLISSLGAGLFTLIFFGFKPITSDYAPYLIGIGLTGGLAQWLITKAYSTGHVLAMGSIGFSTIVFSSLLNNYLAKEPLTMADYMAQGLIIASGLISVWAEAKSKSQTK